MPCCLAHHCARSPCGGPEFFHPLVQSLLQRPWFCLLTDWWILNYYLFLSCPFDCTLLDVQSEHYIPVSNRATLGKDATQKSLGMRMPSVFRLEGIYKNWHLFLFSGSICGIERLLLCTLGFKKLPVTLKHHKSILQRPDFSSSCMRQRLSHGQLHTKYLGFSIPILRFYTTSHVKTLTLLIPV